MVNRAQALVVLAAVALAVVLAGVGLYADGRPAPCTEVVSPAPANTAAGRIQRAQGFDTAYCADFATSALTEQAARWWWYGAGAVLVLGLAALPLAARRGSA